jgi:predicted site-specific integrase-resolvase
MPVPWHRTPTGTIFVDEETTPIAEEAVALYARVSSSDQLADLDRQLVRLVEYATRKGWPVVAAIKEVGSGMNATRPKLLKILRDPKVKTVLVEHRERLTRLGFEQIEAVLYASGRRIQVVEEKEIADDLVRDMTEVLTSFCARLYGRRAARRRALVAVEAAQRVEETSADVDSE